MPDQAHIIEYLKTHWLSLALPLFVFLIILAAGLLARGLVLRALGRWAQRTASHIDNALIEALRTPLLLWVLMLGLHLAAQVSGLPDRVARLVSNGLLILWMLSLTLVATQVAAAVVRRFGHQAHGVVPVTSLSQNLARLAVASIGILILLNQFGLDITPLLTALGVGGLAVALALQDTLTNLFSGFYVSLGGQIRIGDYIKLNTGEEGYVTDIGWRTTTIKALPNNLIIVPNAKLSQAIITNFSLPDPPMSVFVKVTVDSENDPDRVEALMIEEARRASGEVRGLLADPMPAVRITPSFNDGMEFALNCRVGEFTDQFLAQHELSKRILRRFHDEGITLPYSRVQTLQSNGDSEPSPSEEPSPVGGD